MTDHTQSAVNQARYIAKHIMPVTDRAKEAKDAILAAAESGDVTAIREALASNLALYSGKMAWGRRGVMTPELRMLAENLIAKIDGLYLNRVDAAGVAA